jgi:membrane protein YdbS with pleckstrin-like domain
MDVLQGLSPEGTEGHWQNLPVHPDSLPSPAEEDYQPIDAAWLRMQQRRVLLLATAILSGSLVIWYLVGSDPRLLLLPLAAVIEFLAGRYYLPRLYASRCYLLRERDILFRSGVWWRSETGVPYNRVQHCEIAQGPLEKNFGLATLEIYTAGKSTSDLSIPGLRAEVAARVKDHVLGRVSAPDQTPEA